jgi:O-methyltransferase involved in polyketide biosynthesis
MDKILLTEEKETLLIPLFGKAKEYNKKSPILTDKKAVEIVNNIEYNFKSLRIPEKTNLMMCLRAKLIDNFVRDFLAKGCKSAALHLGCGLDSRYLRIRNTEVDWYDVDFEDVINIRKNFYAGTEHYHMIGSSVTDRDWLEKIPKGKKQYIVIAEGLFMYLTEEDIKTLIKRLRNHIGSYTLIFDAFSVFTAKNVKNHPSISKTGAVIHWGIDDPAGFTSYGPDIEFIEEQYFTSNKELENLGTATRLLFKTANLFPAARKAETIDL